MVFTKQFVFQVDPDGSIKYVGKSEDVLNKIKRMSQAGGQPYSVPAHDAFGMEPVMWKELIHQLTSECKFSEPVSPGRIVAADSSLRVEMPADLRELLCETNGIEGEYGLGLVWNLDRIVEENLMFRQYGDIRDLYMPFDHLYFFPMRATATSLLFRFMQTV